MTATASVLAPDRGGALRPRGSRVRWTFTDALTMTWRNLVGYTRVPEAIFFSSVQPIMFVLLFRYVFAGAIQVPGPGGYVDYMMPGIFVQTVAFGSVATAIGLSEDLQKGLIERFRALPMARSAVLAGRTTADLVRNVLVVCLMTGVGYLVGFRVTTDVFSFLAGALVLLLFGYALSWGFATIGLSAPTSETAQLMSFPLLFPLTFASSAFVPVASMPGWLQAFALHQPLSLAVNAARSLMVGGPYHNPGSVWQSVAWSVGIFAVLSPLAVWRYRRTA
ncbi:MAG TPA: ABC transporter permease [Acidimicrobiales bacterium]|nr:ABC transporter permease [Acidimicrobiales bacterium]